MNTIAGIPELHAITYGDPSLIIAVLDGPVDLKHPCFNTAENKLTPWVGNDIYPSAVKNLALNHGTAVTSLIFGRPGSTVAGIAPGCRGLIIPIYSEDSNGNFSSASQVELARSIQVAIEKGARIINISGGQYSKYGESEFLLKKAIDDCYKAGVLIVAAAGNEGCDCLHIPAAHRHVLAVGSMDEAGSPTAETNFGNNYKLNGIIAQGKNLTAALSGGETFQTNGATSYATPIVSGIVALLMSLQIKNGLKPDAYAIKSILENTAMPCTGDGKIDCNRFLRGKLNLFAAMAAIKKDPGILASGIEFNRHKNINSMSQVKQSPLEETTVAIPAGTMEMQPPGIIPEITETLVQTGACMIIPNDHLMPADEMIIPSCNNAEIPVTEISDSITCSHDEPAIIPSELNNIYSGNNIPNQIVNNLNNQKMEQVSTTQNTEVAVLNEPAFTTESLFPSGEIDPADCGCGCGGGAAKAAPPSIVYALGTIGYDFGSEAHRDSFVQSMGGANPNDPAALLKYLKTHPQDAEELVWTLNIDSTPIYALFPTGAHADAAYARIREFFEQQQNGNIQRISVPGVTAGTTTLLNGQKIAVIFPRLRGMFSWTTDALVTAATGAKGTAKALAENVGNFLNRVYYQMRNLGIAPQDRALNYAATNAFQASSVFATALKENLELSDITVEKSPICRPGSDCYDVTLTFFNPKERLTQARKEYRFTVDVSDVVPVTVGEVRNWSVY